MVKIKVVVGLNIPYFLEHAEEIINNTDVLLPYIPFTALSLEYGDYFEALKRKHLHETGKWNAFGRSQTFINRGESEWGAMRRVEREYCEATGHWDLFIWKELDVPESHLKE